MRKFRFDKMDTILHASYLWTALCGSICTPLYWAKLSQTQIVLLVAISFYMRIISLNFFRMFFSR